MCRVRSSHTISPPVITAEGSDVFVIFSFYEGATAICLLEKDKQGAGEYRVQGRLGSEHLSSRWPRLSHDGLQNKHPHFSLPPSSSQPTSPVSSSSLPMCRLPNLESIQANPNIWRSYRHHAQSRWGHRKGQDMAKAKGADYEKPHPAPPPPGEASRDDQAAPETS